MRKALGLLAAALLLVASPALAKVQVRKLVLDPAAVDMSPRFTVLERGAERLTLELSLPSLDLEEIAVGNELFHALTIAGGGIDGEAGAPGLPTITRLVAVPAGMSVSVRVLSEETESFAGYRILPMQPDDADSFVIDRASYARPAPMTMEAVAGETARIRHVTVAPVTFRPVVHDPVSGELRVAKRMVAELTFSGTAERVEAPALIPESFDRMLGDAVAGYERSEGSEVGPGTYLMIYDEETSVLSSLAPLIEWRKQQGYNVVVVSTTTTGAANTQIRSYIQSTYDGIDPPLEFVCLVGDGAGSYVVDTFNETLSGYGGEGDHYYTNLEGGDILADIHIGRLTFGSIVELQNIVDKIVTYETAPPTSDPGWFTRAGLAGDPSSSGITTVYVNQWVKSHLLRHNYTQIDTMWYPNATQMRNSINQGLSVFGYRGYLGMSGLSTGYITALVNGYELPFAVVVTCGTGSFKADGICQSEAFLRAPAGGGIGAVGTATWGTHTRYNNCYYVGCWDGAINGSDQRLGVAHTRGKLELYTGYQLGEPARVEIWSVWNNLMGDPATDMWTGYPEALSVVYPALVAVGANAVPVRVTSGGGPVAGARVALFKEGEIRSIGYTDDSGSALLPISGYSAGALTVTVIGHNYHPHRGSLSLGVAGSYAAYQASTVDDDTSGESSGNADGRINPDESIELPLALRNFGSNTASGVSATIATDDPFVTLTDSAESFGDIPAGGIVWSAEDYDFHVAADAPDGHEIALELVASSGIQTWTSRVALTVQSAAFSLESFAWSGGGAELNPGETGEFSLTLRNVGSISGSGIGAVLTSESPWILIADPIGDFGSMFVGATGNNAADPFQMTVSPQCFEGHLASFTLTLTFNGTAVDAVEFSLPVGTASSNDPLGPDAFGYYAFDNTDTGYPYAPTYNWVEIDPNYGGQGSDLGLSDFGWEQDDTETIALPFDFGYYGVVYDKISICSNGWVAMGETSNVSFRNLSMPCAGSADATLAVYWDNLYQSGTNRVYTWYDGVGHRLIVQWSRVKNDYSDSTQNFELILLDPNYYPTSTGDGEFIYQYETLFNYDPRDGYGTVGMENQERDDGLLYTFWNVYAPAAATLATGRAIRFITLPDLILGELSGDVANASNGGSPVPGAQILLVESNQSLVSESDGHYSGSASVGTFTVRAQHESFETAEVAGVQITEGETTLLDFSLVDILGPYIENTTVIVDNDDTVGPYPVDTNIMDFSEIEDMHFFFYLNGGGPYELALQLIDAQAGHYRAEIPGYPLGTNVKYWLQAEDAAGNFSRDPSAFGRFHEFSVIPAFTAIDDDMEGDLGWTVGDVGDDATAGIWERGEPDGTYNGGVMVQPEEDASADGTLCFVTGNLPTDGMDEDDVEGGRTTLLSPWFDMSGVVSATLQYRRWYTNDAGANPDEDYWVVQITDDGVDWVYLENTNAGDRSWALRSFALGDYIDFTATVRVRFIAQDLSGASIVEAGLDEFQITGFMEADPTAGPENAIPLALTLLQNSPNPFNPVTAIRFGLPAAEKVSLSIYDAQGRLVRELLQKKWMPEGYHEVVWNGRDEMGRPASSGVYFARIATETERRSAKMLLLK